MSWTEENEGEYSEDNQARFVFNKKALADLDDLKKQTKAPSRAETIRNALNLLQWVASEREKGHQLCLETPNGIRAVVLPFLGDSPSD